MAGYGYPGKRGPGDGQKKQFEKMTATHLYCGSCGRSMPVRETLLLVLPSGNIYDYRCEACGDSVGSREETGGVI